MKSRIFVGDFSGAWANTPGAAIPTNGIAAPAFSSARRVTLLFLLSANSLSLWFVFIFSLNQGISFDNLILHVAEQTVRDRSHRSPASALQTVYKRLIGFLVTLGDMAK
jgi:hypothetical protein